MGSETVNSRTVFRQSPCGALPPFLVFHHAPGRNNLSRKDESLDQCEQGRTKAGRLLESCDDRDEGRRKYSVTSRLFDETEFRTSAPWGGSCSRQPPAEAGVANWT
jgi:hypothetical protein